MFLHADLGLIILFLAFAPIAFGETRKQLQSCYDPSSKGQLVLRYCRPRMGTGCFSEASLLSFVFCSLALVLRHRVLTPASRFGKRKILDLMNCFRAV